MKQYIIGSTQINASPDQVFTEVGGEAIILNISDGNYYGLDQIGVRLWQLIQQPVSVDHIINVMVSEYNVEPNVCRNDVITWLQDLAERQLIQIKQ